MRPHSQSRGAWRSAHDRTVLSLACLLSLLAACSDETSTDDAGEPDGWRAQIESEDVDLRAAAVDQIAGSPGKDGLRILERLIVEDPDATVRERAVIDYAQLAGADAIPLLKDVALGDPEPAVASSALASLGAVREALAIPPRATLNVEFPDTFVPGEAFEVRARFDGAASAPKVILTLRLPAGFEALDDEQLAFRGALEAGEPQEVVFRAVAPTTPVQSGARVRLFADYPEELESDEIVRAVRVIVDERGGRFEAQPEPVVRDR
ncbi:MAG: HEAT repeat domain-containing protein [Myxococcales bacterium]|nr:HEAT repeat domain-containing protein [Myxococcales bacterium]